MSDNRLAKSIDAILGYWLRLGLQLLRDLEQFLSYCLGLLLVENSEKVKAVVSETAYSSRAILYCN